MKKWIAVFLSILMLAGGAGVWADPLIQVTMHVNVEAGTVTRDGEPVSAPTPPYAAENGTTMISMSVIADAFGAELTEAEGAVTAGYAGVEMVFTAGSAEAVINGQTIPMPAAAERTAAGDFCVPLRFFAEALGADITYDTETRDITITGSPGEASGEVDFRMLLRYGDVTKVGHSKQGWRFAKPDNFDMSTEFYYYTGEYEFKADDVYISLTAMRNTAGMTHEQMYLYLQSKPYYSGRGALFAKVKDTRNGLPHAAVKIRHTESITEMHAFLTDQYCYIIEAEFPFKTFSAEKENLTLNGILNSFETGYTGGDPETIDLDKKNTEAKEPKTQYKDGNLSWEISPAENWTVNEYYGFGNQVYITRESTVEPDEEEEEFSLYPANSGGAVEDAAICVTTLSNPENEDARAWAEKKQAEQRSRYSERFLEMSPVTDARVGEFDAKTFTMQLKTGKYKRITNMYFINHEGYRYLLTLDYDQRDGEQEGFLALAQQVLNSFRPGEINAAEIGDLLEVDGSYVTDRVKCEVDAEFVKFSMPFLWSKVENEDAVMITSDRWYGYMSYASSGTSILGIRRVNLDSYDDDGNLFYKTLEAYAKESYVELLRTGGREVRVDQPMTQTTFRGRDAYSFTLTQKTGEDEPELTVECLVVENGDNTAVVISKLISEVIKGTFQEECFDAIIESIQLT